MRFCGEIRLIADDFLKVAISGLAVKVPEFEFTETTV